METACKNFTPIALSGAELWGLRFWPQCISMGKYQPESILACIVARRVERIELILAGTYLRTNNSNPHPTCSRPWWSPIIWIQWKSIGQVLTITTKCDINIPTIDVKCGPLSCVAVAKMWSLKDAEKSKIAYSVGHPSFCKVLANFWILTLWLWLNTSSRCCCVFVVVYHYCLFKVFVKEENSQKWFGLENYTSPGYQYLLL